jgi:Ni2+-binding GTPase involved in maturation of urease and hydrogenase
MVGGFLGAGKTTALLRLAQHLTAQGRRVALITNDQSHGLVDTAVAGFHGFPVEEITGGCFCCRFNSLIQAAERLAREARPDVLLAEPVGSCTDLRATVQYPLRRMYGDNFRVAPLSVLVDPIRALRVLGLEPGRTFSDKVLYVYSKQLEEADIIVTNKRDLASREQLDRLDKALRERYPRAELFQVSAGEGTGLEAWLAALAAEQGSRAALEVDYDLYAEGEALLGWLNSTIRLSAAEPFDGNLFLLELTRRIRGRLANESIEIAHLKMTLAPDGEAGDLGMLNLVGTAGEPRLSRTLARPLSGGELILNLRAEGPPGVLREAVEDALAASTAAAGARAEVQQLECFRPARPIPTHRLEAV